MSDEQNEQERPADQANKFQLANLSPAAWATIGVIATAVMSSPVLIELINRLFPEPPPGGEVVADPATSAATPAPVLSASPTPPAPAPDSLDWSSLASIYTETFITPAPVWLGQNSQIWTGAVDNNQYCLTNTTQPDGVHYVYVSPREQMTTAELPVAVEVVQNAPDGAASASGGGVLYRFDEAQRFYYAYLLTGRGEFAFFKRNASGFTLLATGSSRQWETPESNQLGIVGKGPSMHLYINNQLVATVEDGELKGNFTGLVALGQGNYCFDNFAVYEAAS